MYIAKKVGPGKGWCTRTVIRKKKKKKRFCENSNRKDERFINLVLVKNGLRVYFENPTPKRIEILLSLC